MMQHPLIWSHLGLFVCVALTLGAVSLALRCLRLTLESRAGRRRGERNLSRWPESAHWEFRPPIKATNQ